ncbi:MAG TPA: pyrimidine dimer DNA glycosylase/endonuclease V [Nitrospirota bacterium]
MRLWSFHPKYLDPRGLVALWREALLAQKVLQGGTTGYRNHPQLERFKSHPDPAAAIATYLHSIFEESLRRGYAFNVRKIGSKRVSDRISCTRGQLLFEWDHLKKKLMVRCPGKYHEIQHIMSPEPHPLFALVDGEQEAWEVPQQAKSAKPRRRT